MKEDRYLLRILTFLEVTLNSGQPFDTAFKAALRIIPSGETKNILDVKDAPVTDFKEFAERIKTGSGLYSKSLVMVMEKLESLPEPWKKLGDALKYFESRRSLEREFTEIRNFIFMAAGLYIFSTLLFLVFSPYVHTFRKMFIDMDVDLPLLTNLLINLSPYFLHPVFISLLTISMLLFTFLVFFKKDKFIEGFFVIPFIKDILTDRFRIYALNSLINLINSGMTVSEAIEVMMQEPVNKVVLSDLDSLKLYASNSGEKSERDFHSILLHPFELKLAEKGIDKNFIRDSALQTLKLTDRNKKKQKLFRLLIKPLVILIPILIFLLSVIALYLPLYQPSGTLGQ